MSLEKVYYVGNRFKKHWKIREVKADLVLHEGDVLHVSNYMNTVKISGAVMHPNAVTLSQEK